MMQVSVEKNSELLRKIHVEVSSDKINDLMQEKFSHLLKTARMPGFRPGKIPLKLLQKRHGARVRNEAIEEIIQRSLQDAVSQEKLSPVELPKIEDIKADEGKNLHYSASFEIYPKIELYPIEKLQLSTASCKVTQADIDATVLRLRKQHRRLNPVKRKACNEDVVNMDFIGTIDDKPFSGGDAKNYELTLGSGTFIAGFEQDLLGCSAGDDVSIDIKFPEDYMAAHLCNQQAVFKVHINSINEAVLPELDEVFFALFGIKEGGLSAFQEEIRNNLLQESDKLILQKNKMVVFDALIEHHRFTLPKALLQQAKDNLLKQEKQIELSESAINQQVIRHVTLQLVVGKIIEMKKLCVQPNEVRKMIEDMARNYSDPRQFIDWYYADKKRLAQVETMVLEDHLVKLVLCEAKISEKSFSFQELTEELKA